jgi:murein DD-endopeptidase MepM/ murein hydrolase activator NlpD
MARKYTILILPHARTRFRKLHISGAVLHAAAAVAAVLAVGAILAPHFLLRARAQRLVVTQLREANEALREEKGRFEASLDQINRRLSTYEEQARSLARRLGVENVLSPELASGGSAESLSLPGADDPPYAAEFDGLRSRVDQLDATFAQLTEAWQERERILASTPGLIPVRGWFSDGYGWRKDPFTGERAFHRGVDIVAPLGTVVKAPADGVVTRTARWGNLGKLVDVSHGFGYATRYAHLSEILVRPGQQLKRGAVLGRVGSTGRSTGAHLHYEVFRNGRNVNPWRYLGEVAP